MTSKTVRSVNFTPEINEKITEADIKKGELSIWINDKVKKGLLYEQYSTTNTKELENVGISL